MVFNGEQEIESIIHVRMGSKNPSFMIMITVCDRFMMPNDDPQEVFFDPTFTLMIDSYNPSKSVTPDC